MVKVDDERNWSSPSQVVTVGGEGGSEMGDLWEEANVTGQFLFYPDEQRDWGVINQIDRGEEFHE